MSPTGVSGGHSVGGVLTGGGELVHSVSGSSTLACNGADNWAGLTRAGDMYPAPVDGLAQEGGGFAPEITLYYEYIWN